MSNRNGIIRHLSLHLGKLRVLSLTKKDIEKYVVICRAANLSDMTTKRRLSILRAACAWAVNTGMLPENPLLSVKIEFVDSPKILPPDIGELQKILAAAQPHVQRVLIAGLATGARIGPCELFRLQWKDVDFERRIINMPSAQKRHCEKYRPVPIREDFFPWLKLWHKDDMKCGSPYVIHWHGKPVRTIGQSWKRALKKAGITRRIRPYDLRHAFVTNALEAGADLGAIAAIIGHASPRMILRVYQHAGMPACRNVTAVLPRIFPQCEVAGT
ncbi:MAG: site-specific integrase [Synergistaceae bacterium]|nr:site-specific integrase [Synergistaceae bacterium]